MKKILFGCIALCSFFWSANAQRNNPYDGFGKEFVTSVQIIDQDFKAGKIKQMDESTLVYYSKNIPLENKINLELTGEVFNTLQGTTITELVKKSNYSIFGKQILEKMIQQGDIISLVDEVNISSISQSEKEKLLKLLAAGYNLSFNSSMDAKHSTLGGGMYFIGGFLIGDIICGPVCGAAGAVIGCFIEYIK